MKKSGRDDSDAKVKVKNQITRKYVLQFIGVEGENGKYF